MTTCYHEAVPGHHLQVAQVRYLADKLSRFQRAFGFVSGHGEGWALYAERLMGELGYLDDSRVRARHARRAGDARGARDRRHRHAPRAAEPRARRRDVDAGARAAVRDRAGALPGRGRSCAARSTATSAGRARRSATRSARRCGSTPAPTRSSATATAFDLKAFHSYALDLGSMGLGPLRDELARF